MESMMSSMQDEQWMAIALEQARLAAAGGEVPIGAVAVIDDRVVAAEHNRSIELSDPTAHAEILTLRSAGQKLANYRLREVDLYVTLEPCAMCAGAVVWARIRRLIVGAQDPKAGAVFSQVQLLKPGLFNHTVELVSDVRADVSRQLLRDFFAQRR